ncbi:MAG: hypothetical protein ACHBN1_14310 [Heteroscytonema crispum UTEX LB 1556]
MGGNGGTTWATGVGRRVWATGVGDKEINYQLTTNNQQRPFGRTSTRSVTKSAVRASPTTTLRENQSPALVLPSRSAPSPTTNNQQPTN